MRIIKLADADDLDKKEEKELTDSNILGVSEFAEALIEDYRNEYIMKYPFERAKYHQCIPNPSKDGEFITL